MLGDLRSMGVALTWWAAAAREKWLARHAPLRPGYYSLLDRMDGLTERTTP